MKELVRLQEEPGYTRFVCGEPFLRWVGGKRQLLPTLLPMAPKSFGTYYEPFVGGGAMFFALGRKKSILNDSNWLLIMTYRQIRDDAAGVISLLRKMERDWKGQSSDAGKLTYYQLIRNQLGAAGPCSDSRNAAQMIFLNKTCFNGLWRVNKAGRFNVPMGKFKTPPTICNEELLHECSKALAGVELLNQDFAEVMSMAQEGDFIYCDPPYVPLSKTSNFTGYTKGGFGEADQKRLYMETYKAVKRGVKVIVSNSSDPIVREIWNNPQRFEIIEVDARRAVNSDASKRGAVKELIVKSKGW